MKLYPRANCCPKGTWTKWYGFGSLPWWRSLCCTRKGKETVTDFSIPNPSSISSLALTSVWSIGSLETTNRLPASFFWVSRVFSDPSLPPSPSLTVRNLLRVEIPGARFTDYGCTKLIGELASRRANSQVALTLTSLQCCLEEKSGLTGSFVRGVVLSFLGTPALDTSPENLRIITEFSTTVLGELFPASVLDSLLANTLRI